MKIQTLNQPVQLVTVFDKNGSPDSVTIPAGRNGMNPVKELYL
jgi:hypothetical protein